MPRRRSFEEIAPGEFMQQRRVRLGDILDDYCPRERRVTNHAVVAMIDDEVKQTRCTTCQSDHEYKSAKVPPPRRRKAGALSGDEAEGVIRPRAASAAAGESEAETEERLEGVPGDSVDTVQAGADESLDALPEVDVDADAEAPSEPLLAEGDTEMPQPDAADEGDEDAGAEQDNWPVHRPLIRATLPRPEGQLPERKPTDFTFRPGGTGTARFDQGNANGKRRGHRPMRAGQGQGQPQQGQNRFGPPRQGSGQPGQRPPQGQRPGNRQGPGQGQGPGGGGRPGQARGPRQGSGPGRKRGR
jgi:hypothetical protein